MRVKLSSKRVTLSTRRKVASGSDRCVLFLEIDTANVAPSLAEDAAKPVWVQIAAEGDYKGYEGGAFKFDRAVFDNIVSNFQSHPAYATGGGKDVIPWDFHHASEFSPVLGSIPSAGVPAQGWVRELEVRQGARGLELWALTRWLEPARTYIKDGKYKWASVTVYFGTKDPVSGEERGANLVSVALTNQPFIEGMQELVAAQRGGAPAAPKDGGRAAASGDAARLMYSEALGIYYEAAKDANDALAQLRKVFGLSQTSGAAEVVTELTKLQQWSMGGVAPLGVDVGALVGCVRHILGLRALADAEEVFAEASKLVQALLEQEAAEATPASSIATEKNMDLIKFLAQMYGVVATEAAVREAAEQHSQARLGLAKAFGLSPITAFSVILEKANESAAVRAKLTALFEGLANAAKVVLEKSPDGGDVRTKLGALLKAIGVEDSDGAVTRVAEMMAKASELETLMPELAGLRESVAKAEEAAVEEEVTEAMASYNLPENCKDALVLMRKGKDGKKAFAEKFPKKTPAAGGAEVSVPALLQSVVAAGPNGTERRVVADSNGRVTLEQLGSGPAGKGGSGGEITTINLAVFSGRNKTERMVEYVRAQLGAAAKTTDYPVIFSKALELLHSPKVKVIDAVA